MSEHDPAAPTNVPAAPTVELHPNPAKMSPAAARKEARALRSQDRWTVAELKRRYGPRWNADWLEGIKAPVSTLSSKQAEKAARLAAKPKEEPVQDNQPTDDKPPTPAESTDEKAARQQAKAVRDADHDAKIKAEQDLTGKPSGAAGGRQDAGKAKTEPRQVSKAAAARQSVARAKAAQAKAEEAKTQGNLETAAAKASAPKGRKAPKAKGTTASKPQAKPASKPATSTGSGVSGRTLGYKKPLDDDAVRLIRSMYGNAKRAEIIAAVEQAHGVTPNVQTIDKIGKRVSRKNVPDTAPTSKAS